MTNFPEIWNALAAEFHEDNVASRTGGGNRTYRYITARTAMNRLDAVLGFENWEDEFERDPGGGDNITCRLTITLPDGRRITKADAGAPGSTVPGPEQAALPAPAPTEADPGPPAKPKPEPWGGRTREPAPAPTGRVGGNGKIPATGRALFAWAKEQDEKHQVGVVKYLGGWGKLQEFPGRLVDWDAEQARQGHAEAVRKLQSIELHEEALAN
jgi:hypothetical protein